MTKKKAITREQAEAQRNAWSSGTPSLIQERATEFNQRMRKLCYSPTRICNSSMPRHDHYTTGFGEVIQPVRPGADDHMAHPSLFIGRRSWRDGRVEVARMSWLFSQALVAEYSAGTSLAGEPCVPLNVMPTQHKFWRNDKTMEPSDLSQFGLTCAVLTEGHGAELLMLYLAGSRAKTSARQVKAPVCLESGLACGEKWRESLAKFDRGSSTWKTAQFSLLEDSELYSETWPRWGLMLSGESYRQPTPQLRTYESGSGLWPTPVASDTGSRKKPYAQGGTPLSLAVKLWPTPTTMKSTGGPALCKWGGAGARKKMATMVTPAEMNGPLNPPWVEWLMGWPIGWSDLTPLEMGRFQEWQQQHSIY